MGFGKFKGFQEQGFQNSAFQIIGSFFGKIFPKKPDVKKKIGRARRDDRDFLEISRLFFSTKYNMRCRCNGDIENT